MKKILDIFDKDNHSEKRQPRIKVDYLNKISFCFPDLVLKNDFMVKLKNISTSGVAFEYEGLNCQFNIGDKLIVSFKIYDHECDVQIQFVRITGDIIGARVLSNLSSFAQLISKFYKVELSAADMSYIESEKLNPVLDGDPHWYHGDNNCELYFVERSSRIINFHITFFGNAIEFGKSGNLIYGHVWGDEQDRDKDIYYKGSQFIKVVDSIEDEIIEESMSFVRQVPLLDEDLKQQIVDIITSHVKIQAA
jgi:hypothetical protein